MDNKSTGMSAASASIEARLRDVLRDTLSLKDATARALDADTPLFGAMPELDSMAVATLLTEVEDRFGIMIDDDDVDGETFETFGTLTVFVESKLAARGNI
ncbi:MAG: acyl carrier protein [Sphingobium sp.]|jgi:acyl carrier protein|nr:acyl carrier protein [Sphingobium sp.]MCI1272378.1 acyl carrier protein [Sphingobium sp.]MCI1755012.1 acyl carrier protein [Sphingobium sp.]MCI2051761.1 acyl carrier protein [Sphingobium sp.]